MLEIVRLLVAVARSLDFHYKIKDYLIAANKPQVSKSAIGSVAPMIQPIPNEQTKISEN